MPLSHRRNTVRKERRRLQERVVDIVRRLPEIMAQHRRRAAMDDDGNRRPAFRLVLCRYLGQQGDNIRLRKSVFSVLRLLQPPDLILLPNI